MTIARNCLLLLLAAVTSRRCFSHRAGNEVQVPRTEAGQPDLRGVWNFSTNVPLERPSAFADKKLFTR